MKLSSEVKDFLVLMSIGCVRITLHRGVMQFIAVISFGNYIDSVFIILYFAHCLLFVPPA